MKDRSKMTKHKTIEEQNNSYYDFEKKILKEYKCIYSAIDIADKLRKVDDVAYNTGVTMAGPILYGYVDWILTSAVEKGLQYLYFIARDGYLPMKIAEELIDLRKLPLKCIYVYGSRRAWRYYEEDKELDWYITNNSISSIHSVEDLSNLLFVEPNIFNKKLPEWAFTEKKELCSKTLPAALKLLESDENVMNSIIKAAKEHQCLAKEYLKELIIKDSKDYAFVELTGTGLTQSYLRKLLDLTQNDILHTYYLLKDGTQEFFGCNNEGYKTGSWSVFLELICRAPHGQTNSYIYDKQLKKTVPVLSEQETEALLNNDIEKFIKGAVDFCTNYYKEYGSLDRESGILLADKYLSILENGDDETSLKYLYNVPYCHSGFKNVDTEKIVYTKEDIKNIYYFGNKKFSREFDELYYEKFCSKEIKELIQSYRSDKNSPVNIERKKQQKYASALSYPIEVLYGKVVLYGAGKRGVCLYDRIKTYCKNVTIVGWIDKNVSDIEYPIGDIKVTGLESLFNMNYDIIAVTILDKDISKKCYLNLLEMGVPASKILWGV